MKKDAVINLRIDSELKRKLQDKCYEKRLKMTEAIEEAIEQWLENDSTQSLDDSATTTDIIYELKQTLIHQQEQLNEQQQRLDQFNNIDQQQHLDERLAMALEPVWEVMESNMEGLSCQLPITNSYKN